MVIFVIIYALFAFTGWALAWYINEDWYKSCQKLNTDWHDFCAGINDDWYELCKKLEEKDDD